MEIYLIVTRVSKTYGHSDFGIALEVAMRGSYGEGGPAPTFLNKAAAEAYAADRRNGHELEVLPLTVS